MEGDDPSPGMNLFHADIRRMIGALDVIYEDENEVNMITRSQSKKVTFIPTLEQVHPQVPHRLSKDSPKATIGGISFRNPRKVSSSKPYTIFNNLNTIKANISIMELIITSATHRNALIKEVPFTLRNTKPTRL